MKFQVLSDLHIDSYAKRQKPLGAIVQTDADLILVAGDTANSDLGMHWLQQQAEINGKPVDEAFDLPKESTRVTIEAIDWWVARRNEIPAPPVKFTKARKAADLV